MSFLFWGRKQAPVTSVDTVSITEVIDKFFSLHDALVGRITEVEKSLDDVRKMAMATQRKVYRDVEAGDAPQSNSSLVERPGDGNAMPILGAGQSIPEELAKRLGLI
jgi:hypothetical protein